MKRNISFDNFIGDLIKIIFVIIGGATLLFTMVYFIVKDIMSQ